MPKHEWKEIRNIGCPYCGGLTFTLRTDQEVRINWDDRRKEHDIIPSEAIDIDYRLYCSHCKETLPLSDEILRDIDFFVS